ncbi:MAG: hypothetical protein KatS3mg022_3667 [Armatimonadota bacterium]|nr:MAG: hypothetical protein KatS3mg022_3667 [Armatimonadota bacterium]
MFQRFIRVVHERQELISIGIFGLIQMLADAVADFGCSSLAALIRLLGIVFVIWVLAMSYRRHTAPLSVPLLFAEEESRETLRAHFDRFVRTAQLQKQVSPVQPLVYQPVVNLNRIAAQPPFD